MRFITTALTILFLLASLPLFSEESQPSASPVEMTLTLDPPATLPGIPVAFHVRLTNRSQQPLTVPGALMLEVEPQNGPSFVSRYAYSGHVGGFPSGTDLRLNPGETKEIPFLVESTLLTPAWFFDERLSVPGTYRLRLTALSDPPIEGDVTVAVEELAAAAEAQFSKRRGRAIVSTPAVLTVKEPEGEDAKVWARMQEITKGKGWSTKLWVSHGFGLANEIWREHPTSYYLHLTAMLGSSPDGDESIKRLQSAIDMHPDGPRADLLRLTMASRFARIAHESAKLFGDLPKALAAADQARSVYEAVIRTARAAALREEAREAILGVPDRATLATYAQLANKRSLKQP